MLVSKWVIMDTRDDVVNLIFNSVVYGGVPDR